MRLRMGPGWFSLRGIIRWPLADQVGKSYGKIYEMFQVVKGCVEHACDQDVNNPSQCGRVVVSPEKKRWVSGLT